jgi:crotonobetainyl-CoA:carnitine CoA-transferase CaiB-like acyl-CoA transferase
MTEQALSETKVLDLTHYIAGPYCTRLLAGFGAEIIKIERPDGGDPARRIGPFLNDEPGAERSGLFLYLNSGKKSITLNLKSDSGVKIFKELVRDADVVVENFAPRVMPSLGLDYEVLSRINPQLVMTSVSNFGQTGPYRDFKSSHLVAWGMSGGRYADGEPGKKPVQGGGWLSHYIAGLYGAIGTANALYQSRATGKGQPVDISIFELMLFQSPFPPVVYSYQGVVHAATTRARIGVFECQDGYVGLNVYTMLQWEMLCTMLGLSDYLQDPNSPKLGDVRERYDEVRALFSPIVKEKTREELFQMGTEWRVPISFVPTTAEILESPQHRERGFLEEVDHPVMGKVTMPGAPFKMSETPWQMKNPAPWLGEHNEDIYCHRLGYSKDELVRLRERGVV